MNAFAGLAFSLRSTLSLGPTTIGALRPRVPLQAPFASPL